MSKVVKVAISNDTKTFVSAHRDHREALFFMAGAIESMCGVKIKIVTTDEDNPDYTIKYRGD